MNAPQLIDRAAEAMYQSWQHEENLRRAEARARLGKTFGNPQQLLPRPLLDYEALRERDREVFRRRARPVIDRLIQDGLLVAGEPRMFDVVIDDPDLKRVYEFEGVQAWSAYAASYEGARRAVEIDPLTFLNVGARKDWPLATDIETAERLVRESPGLIDAVQMYSKVWRHGHSREGNPITDTDAAWKGYA